MIFYECTMPNKDSRILRDLEKAREAALAAIPMKRAGQVEDIANLAAFLASDEASYITGEVIKVDGGLAI